MLSTHDHIERIAAAGRSRALRGDLSSITLADVPSREVWMVAPATSVKATNRFGSTSPPRPEEALSP